MNGSVDPTEHGFEENGDACPECGGTVFERYRPADSSAGQRLDLRVLTCRNYGDECEYYEQVGQCPECGSENLSSDVRGPDRLTGARSGRVTCEDCSFAHQWSE